MDITDHLADEFTVAELTLIAEQVGLAPVSRWSQRQLVDAIIAKLDRDGIPHPPSGEVEELPKGALLLEEFLYIGLYVDDNGNPIKKTGKLPLDEFMRQHNLTRKPDCYGFADDKDPSCKRCVLYLYCAAHRIANLKPCYAILWENGHPECTKCLDATFCKEAVLSKQGAK